MAKYFFQQQYKAFFAERPKSFPYGSTSKPMAAFVTIGLPSFPICVTVAG